MVPRQMKIPDMKSPASPYAQIRAGDIRDGEADGQSGPYRHGERFSDDERRPPTGSGRSAKSRFRPNLWRKAMSGTGADSLISHPARQPDFLIGQAVSAGGLLYDVQNPYCRFKVEHSL